MTPQPARRLSHPVRGVSSVTRAALPIPPLPHSRPTSRTSRPRSGAHRHPVGDRRPRHHPLRPPQPRLLRFGRYSLQSLDSPHLHFCNWRKSLYTGNTSHRPLGCPGQSPTALEERSLPCGCGPVATHRPRGLGPLPQREIPSKTGEPALISKCSQQRPRPPLFRLFYVQNHPDFPFGN